MLGVRWLVIAAVLVGAAGSASAEEGEVKDPRKFFLGLSGGMYLGYEYDEFFDEEQLSPGGALGLEIGIQRVSGGKMLTLEVDALPLGGIYRGRGAIVLGWGFNARYREPCAAPPGYSCTLIYNYKKVASVFGLKLGGEIGMSPDGEYSLVEAGLAFRGQLGFDIAAAYDPVLQAPGGTMDMYFQIGPAYFGMELRGVFAPDEQHPQPLLLLMNLGYASRMW